MYFSPRIADSIAARAENIAPIMKAILKDGMNASARVVGNQVVPVRVVFVAAGIIATTFAGKADKIASTGLYPRKAENNAPDGGILLRSGASLTAPILASEAVIASGKRCVIPIITMVKNIAILAVNAVFIMVYIIPEAIPLSSGATEFIMDELLGDANIPEPIPIINRIIPNSQ